MLKSPMTKWLMAVALIASTPTFAYARSPDPMTILRKAKAAAGGASMDAKTGSYEEGDHGKVHYQTWLAYRTYGMRSDSERDGVHTATGFNGRVQWRLGADGKVTIKDDPATLSEAITTAYASNNAYFYPDRFPATFRYVREARDKGEAFDVIETTPKGGRAFELWFDRRTHLLARIVDRNGTPPVWVELKHRRDIGGAVVAMGGVIHKLDGTVLEDMQVGKVEYRDVPASTFDPPASK